VEQRFIQNNQDIPDETENDNNVNSEAEDHDTENSESDTESRSDSDNAECSENTPPRVTKYYDFIKKLCTSSANQRKKYLSEASNNEILAICDCVHNVCNGNVEISKEKINKLYPFRFAMRKLTSPVSTSTKRDILIQTGGFLPQLAGVILPTILSLLVK
jgi:hypothetical protein